MKIDNKFLFLLLFGLLLSCKPQKDLSYMQDIEDIAVEASVKNAVLVIQQGDVLQVDITANDMDVVAPFNNTYSSAGSSPSFSQSGNSSAAGGSVPPSSAKSYKVDSNGEINMPVLGKVAAAGLSNEEFADKVQGMLTRYIKDPVVTVRTTNFRISVLGEVARPGTFNIPDGAVTLPAALGLAGDLTIYGKRDNVLLVRNENGQISRERLDLTSSEFFNSPYFYLKQNDLIYVSSNPTRQKTSSLDPNVGIYISVASVILGLLALLVR